jgi:hypothetical protein
MRKTNVDLYFMWVNEPAAVKTRKPISISSGMANLNKPFILEFSDTLYVDCGFTGIQSVVNRVAAGEGGCSRVEPPDFSLRQAIRH